MVRRRDLVDISDKDYRQRQNEYVECQDCGYSFGGTRGDYFMIPMDSSFTCDNCGGKNLALVKDKVITEIIEQWVDSLHAGL
jgi:Zn finger protein HypA/HybF involved in hydrogenase expression